MARTRTIFPRDRGLQIRMLFTLFLLGALYVVFAGVIFAAGAGIGVIVLFLAGLSLAQLFLSDKLALSAIGAKVVSPAEAPGLHAMIERLCIQADLPKPRIAVAESHVPNAFAMGRSQKSAVVCATTAIIETLEPHELEGVLAHELTHVKNRDVMIMTIASFFASIASAIAQFSLFFGGGGSDDDDGPGFLVVFLVSMAVYAISFFLMLALSRYREFAADRGAALITGRPSALASALLKLNGAMQRVPDQDLRQAERMNAFFIIPTSVKSGLHTLFLTHPPMEKRIAALRALETQIQAPLAAWRVGLFDAILGGRKKLQTANSDRLFAMATAQVTLETSLNMKSRGRAAIVFQQINSADFKQILSDSEDLIKSAAADTGTTIEQADDDYGYRWMVFSDPDFDDLVTAVNTVASELQAGGYGDRVLAAVFSWDDNGQEVDFIYNFKRGRFYPFVPRPGKQRDTEYELRIKAQLETDLPFEPELERWFPLWDAPLS